MALKNGLPGVKYILYLVGHLFTQYILPGTLRISSLPSTKRLTSPTKREKENHRLKRALGLDILVPRMVFYQQSHEIRRKSLP